MSAIHQTELEGVRPCRPCDLPAVTALYQQHFGRRQNFNGAALAAYLHDVLFDHPWSEPDICSLVHVDSAGRVEGFIGVIPVRFVLGQQRLRGALAGMLAVANHAQNPLAGARLLRSYLSGPQDISLTVSANALSAGMWQRLGHQPIVEYSMDWIRVLRPFGFASQTATRLFRPARLARGPASLADRLIDRVGINPLTIGARAGIPAVSTEVDDAALIAHIQEFGEEWRLRPCWDKPVLDWLLSHAAAKEDFGTINTRLVKARNGKPIGCYIFHGRRGGIADVLQILSRRGEQGKVVEDLLRHAHSLGCVAVRGKAQPGLNEHLMQRRAVFFCVASTIAASRHPTVITELRAGNALVTGLAGDAWSRLHGGRFD